MNRRRLFGATGALAVLGLAPTGARALSESNVDPALRGLMAANPLALLPVIVEMRAAVPPFLGDANVGRALQALGLLGTYGIAVAPLSLINAAAGFANAAAINAISLVPTVAFIHHDRTVGPRNSCAPPPPTAPGQSSSVYPRVVRADKVQNDGVSGNGVTVAVLDSGVAADPDLMGSTNRVLASVNFADPRAADDPGGHGTHIAGIIAGNGARSDGEFAGIAPQANIVDVRVLATNGSGRVSSVVRGIEWVLAHRALYNIRVINLSFGAPAPLSYRADPFSAGNQRDTPLELHETQTTASVIASSGNLVPSCY